jgi:small subunit ribosomal protein S16
LLRIRLSRVGKKKQPSYRLIVTDSRAPRDGAFIKIIGHYNPRTEPDTLVVKEEEAVEWLRRGAQPSETAAKLLTRIGVMERAGRAPVMWDRKTPVMPKKVKEEAPAEAATAAPPAKAEAAPEPQPEPETVEGAEAEAQEETKAAATEEQPEPETAEATEARARKKTKAAAAEEQPEPPAEAEGETPENAETTE